MLHACARALLVVAHADDETLFAGEALLGRAAALPGGCRRVSWHVVCVTGFGSHRRQEFRAALQIARSRGFSAEITEDMWDFEDCNSMACMYFPTGPSHSTLGERLSQLLVHPERMCSQYGKGWTAAQCQWDYVVTHNDQGEYGHLQHVGLHQIIKGLINKGIAKSNPHLLVFNPLPELNVTASAGKDRMLQAYVAREVNPARMLLFDSLIAYTEHLVMVTDFVRPKIIGLSFFPGSRGYGFSHFMYHWANMPHRDWGGGFNHFSASDAMSLAKPLLAEMHMLSCHRSASSSVPFYPQVCNALVQTISKTDRLAELLEKMESFAYADEMTQQLDEPTRLPAPSSISGRPGPDAACARALLIVAHTSDETIFAGEALVGRMAALPGRCRHVSWHVVCVTGQLSDRKMPFGWAIELATRSGLAQDISKETWDFEECDMPTCSNFPARPGTLSLVERIQHRLLHPEDVCREFAEGRWTHHHCAWDFVVTHNEQGEHNDLQHQGLHRAVKKALQEVSMERHPQLMVFNPLPELNVTLSSWKHRMVQAYTAHDVKPMYAYMLNNLVAHTEHLVDAERFSRPAVLGLGALPDGAGAELLHYMYNFGNARGADLGNAKDSFKSQHITELTTQMLEVVIHEACETRDANVAYYPAVCGALAYLLANHKSLDDLSQKLEAAIRMFSDGGIDVDGINSNIQT